MKVSVLCFDLAGNAAGRAFLLARLLEPHRDELSFTPRLAARTLRALVFAMSHPMMVEEPASPPEIAEVFLHGVTKKGASC